MTDAVLPLLVVVPIAAAVAPFVASLRFEDAGWYVAAAATTVELALAVYAASLFVGAGRYTHELGGVDSSYGIELALDGLSAPVAVLVAAVAFGVLAYTRSAGPRGNAFYSAYLLLTGGLMGVSVTADVFNMYVFLEITGLTAYALVASDGGGRSAYAAFQYLIIGTVGASLYLVGVGYAFVATGTLNMHDLSLRLAEVGYTDTLVLASFAFVVAGLAVKTALYPLHTWQPDAYAAAPYGVAGYVAALVSTVAAYALGRVVLTVYTPEFLSTAPVASSFLLYFAAFSVVAGSALAVLQTDVRRMLAYSSVSQFGIVVAAFAVATPTAVYGGVVHLVGHAVVKAGLFLGAGALAYTAASPRVDALSGVAGDSRVASASVATLLFVLVGVPPSVVFVGKWYVAVGAIEAGQDVVAAVVLVSTLLTLAYSLRVVDHLYFGDRAAADGGERRVTVGMLAVVSVAAVAAVALGLAAAYFEPLLRIPEVVG